MELAPLTEARTHVRRAAVLAHKSNIKGAKNEHKAAAEYFGKAKGTTKDPEALRILALLEEQHHNLAQSESSSPSIKDTNPSSLPSDVTSSSSSSSSTPTARAGPTSQSGTAQSPGGQRSAVSSSSGIAGNLAKARGSASATPTPSHSGRTSGGGVLPNNHNSKSTTPYQSTANLASSTASSTANTPSKAQVAANEKAFTQFYNTTKGGILPFPILATLPQADEAGARSYRESKSLGAVPTGKGRESSTRDRLSATTLRAITSRNPTAESFFIVPATGGVESYAKILQLAGKGKDTAAGSSSNLPKTQEGHPPSTDKSSRSGKQSKIRFTEDTKGDNDEVSSKDGFVDMEEGDGNPRRGKSVKIVGGSIRAGQGSGRKSDEEVEAELMMLRSVITKLTEENKSHPGTRLASAEPSPLGTPSEHSHDDSKRSNMSASSFHPPSGSASVAGSNSNASTNAAAASHAELQGYRARIRDLEDQATKDQATIKELSQKLGKTTQSYTELRDRWMKLEARAKQTRHQRSQQQQQLEDEKQKKEEGGGGAGAGEGGKSDNLI